MALAASSFLVVEVGLRDSVFWRTEHACRPFPAPFLWPPPERPRVSQKLKSRIEMKSVDRFSGALFPHTCVFWPQLVKQLGNGYIFQTFLPCSSIFWPPDKSRAFCVIYMIFEMCLFPKAYNLSFLMVWSEKHRFRIKGKLLLTSALWQRTR